ncbi:hypothetical protein RV18_GL002519 [Enterococcus termitis]|nr:hypothetical protein RV18_GL002519 [Enterococcus termitis]
MALYTTQYWAKINDKNSILDQLTNYFSYYDLSFFILLLIPLFLFSLAVFIPENKVYQDVRSTKKNLYISMCIRNSKEIGKFIAMYFIVGLPIFFIFSNQIVLSEYVKQTLIFFLILIISVQFYMLIEIVNGNKRKFTNSFLSAFLIMGSYFQFKSYFSFFNLNYIYYLLNLDTSITLYLPILVSIPLFLCCLNYEMFKRKDFL